ncbi:MAG: hypothetical protein K9L98_03715 [Candidatus Pacebacteria bacterium]|nr:hypothetical protein [Candidatus Paceibacterota bacterium]MCF7863084.1 hypothetical protein [Candidatus Paceibacterota bacterium]
MKSLEFFIPIFVGIFCIYIIYASPSDFPETFGKIEIYISRGIAFICLVALAGTDDNPPDDDYGED